MASAVLSAVPVAMALAAAVHPAGAATTPGVPDPPAAERDDHAVSVAA